MSSFESNQHKTIGNIPVTLKMDPTSQIVNQFKVLSMVTIAENVYTIDCKSCDGKFGGGNKETAYDQSVGTQR